MDYIYLQQGTPEWEYFVRQVREAGDFNKDLRISVGKSRVELVRSIKVKVGGGMWSHPLYETAEDFARG